MRLRRRLRLWWRYEHDKRGLVASSLALLLLIGVAAFAVQAADGRVIPTAHQSARPVVSLAPSPAPEYRVLWFGDSLVEGCCRTRSDSPNIAQVASRAMGWTPTVRGFGGTGYVTSRRLNNETRLPYPDAIKPVLSRLNVPVFKVAVVMGGNNDDKPSLDEAKFRAAVRRTLAEVRAAMPHARLVVVGPYSPSGTGRPTVSRIEREETARAHGTYIEQLGFMRGHPEMIASDKYHPNDAGQVLIGTRLAAAFKAAGLKPVTAT